MQWWLIRRVLVPRCGWSFLSSVWFPSLSREDAGFTSLQQVDAGDGSLANELLLTLDSLSQLAVEQDEPHPVTVAVDGDAGRVSWRLFAVLEINKVYILAVVFCICTVHC